MSNIKWSVDLDNVIGEVKGELYGGFVEHLGRNVYGGIYDPGSPVADEDGFRKDVIELVRELNMPVTRYPGGCYVDLERWEDSVGKERRSRIDPAWHQIEPNTFGLDEFMKWAKKADTTPLITINTGNRSLLDTLSLYEYCNIPGGTYWSEQRRANGVEKPYNIKNWCIGNELYGNWEIGQMSVEEYARNAREHGKLLKKVDPDCRLIASGSPYDMAWNRKLLELAGKYIDVISLHDAFYMLGDTTEFQYLKSIERFEKYLTDTIKECKAYEALNGKRIAVSVDEWIIWDFERRMRPEEEWTTGMHLLEQDYTILEALIAGSFFSCLHRHAADVDIACIAQSVNVIAPIRTEPDGTCWKQSIYYPFELTSRYGRGISLKVNDENNDKGYIYGSAVWNKEHNEITLFVTNRAEEACEFSCALPANTENLNQCITMFCNDHKAVNGPGNSKNIAPKELQGNLNNSTFSSTLPPVSWSMIRIQLR